jgi:uncharacterized protein (TIGR04255 family)
MGTLFPRALGKSPLVTSTAELRFSSGLPVAALFGMLYGAERERYPNVEQLPAANMPPQVMQIDPNFQFQAHFALKRVDGGPILQIGPKVFSATGTPGHHIDVAYLRGEFLRVLEALDSLKVVTSYDRLGLRYINFFENHNVLRTSTLALSLEETALPDDDVQMRVQLPSDGYTTTFNVMSNAQVAFGGTPMLVAPADAKKGSLIDIDVFKDSLDVPPTGGVAHIVEQFVDAHDVAKRLFFKSLKDEFVRELKPTF